MEIFFFKIDSSSRKTISLLNMVSDRTMNRLDKINHSIKRSHVLYSDLLLQYVLHQQQRIKPPIRITYNKQGKPFLVDGCFNISHSNEWIMCAYSNHDVGVDIEEYEEYSEGLAKFFFTEDEVSHLENLPKNEQIKFFVDTWTFKESYVKTKGISIFNIKNNIKAPEKRDYFLKEEIKINEKILYYVRGFIENYGWCVISEKNFANYNIKVVSYNDLINTLNNLYH